MCKVALFFLKRERERDHYGAFSYKYIMNPKGIALVTLLGSMPSTVDPGTLLHTHVMTTTHSFAIRPSIMGCRWWEYVLSAQGKTAASECRVSGIRDQPGTNLIGCDFVEGAVDIGCFSLSFRLDIYLGYQYSRFETWRPPFGRQ